MKTILSSEKRSICFLYQFLSIFTIFLMKNYNDKDDSWRKTYLPKMVKIFDEKYIQCNMNRSVSCLMENPNIVIFKCIIKLLEFFNFKTRCELLSSIFRVSMKYAVGNSFFLSSAEIYFLYNIGILIFKQSHNKFKNISIGIIF